MQPSHLQPGDLPVCKKRLLRWIRIPFSLPNSMFMFVGRYHCQSYIFCIADWSIATNLWISTPSPTRATIRGSIVWAWTVTRVISYRLTNDVLDNNDRTIEPNYIIKFCSRISTIVIDNLRYFWCVDVSRSYLFFFCLNQ